MNKVKPTEKQKEAFKHMKTAKTLQEAMLKGGYSIKSSENPKQNFVDRAGTQTLIQEYKELVEKAGISPEIMAEVEAAGLFSENDQTRLNYLKELKKTFGISQDTPTTAIQVNFNGGKYIQ